MLISRRVRSRSGWHHAVGRRFSRGGRDFRRTPPNRGWAGVVATGGTTLGASSKVIAASFSLDNDGIDETILRNVGGIGIASDQAAASETQTGALGMCIVTDTALALGITALPDPVTDASDDVWLLYVSWFQELRFSDATGFEPQFSTWYPFDSKAKRVVHSGTSIAVIVANANASFGFKFGLNLRLLTQVRGT